MIKVIVNEVFKVTADPAVFGDMDKLILVLDYGEGERKITIPWKNFKTKPAFEKILATAIQEEKPKKEVINMTSEWKGEYNI